jgi:hypothetical protein
MKLVRFGINSNKSKALVQNKNKKLRASVRVVRIFGPGRGKVI